MAKELLFLKPTAQYLLLGEKHSAVIFRSAKTFEVFCIVVDIILW